MSFVLPIALVLLLPLGGLLVLVSSGGAARIGRLPGAWHQVVAPDLKAYLARRSNLTRAGVPVHCFTAATLIILALARPGLDTEDTEKFASLAGRVIILDVGSDLTLHRHFIDDLHRTDPGVATAVIASSGDAYRIVPFTTDASQIERYVRVLNAEMMPKPGHSPHLAVAQAERILADGGYLVRQIILVTARQAPDQIIEIPSSQSRRFTLTLIGGDSWADWAAAQNATALGDDAVVEIARALRKETIATARSELPSARVEFTTWLIGLAAFLCLLMFRRRAS